MVDFLNSC